MNRSWTYGKKVAAGFAAVLALAMVIGGIGVYALRAVVDAKDEVIDVDAAGLALALQLDTASEWEASSSRGFALTGAERFTNTLAEARSDFVRASGALETHVRGAEGRRLLAAVRRTATEYDQVTDELVQHRRNGNSAETLARDLVDHVLPKRDALRDAVDAVVAYQEDARDRNAQAASDRATDAITLVIVTAAIALLIAIVLGLVLTRALSRQIGEAVQHVQSSSSELQAAANQQVTGAKEQATAMTEITTTISELLATSRQIAESAQRVAHIAEETAGSARAGEKIVESSTESMTAIRRQVDQIVSHMLELGKKSQQIGGVLELINELADQTNILAINATIEAAGAGEAGRRFAVVADEIRKLADRVGASTKEIRGLIDDIRAAVNTTVMATEGGSKAVDTGAQQFADVAESLAQIASLVGTTTEAAREIELSTKQQASAVEQVNVAVANVAQASRETEASSSQTLQTASQLTGLSRDLLKLVQPQASA